MTLRGVEMHPTAYVRSSELNIVSSIMEAPDIGLRIILQP